MVSHPKIIDIEELDESINMLVYGPSGVGKTVFGGSADKVLFLAVEQGTVSAKRQGSKAKVWPIEKWSDLEEAYLWLNENPDHGFQWVVLDSVTQMQQMALRAILDEAVAENGSRDPDIPAIHDHQKWQNMFKRFILAFCDLPVNVLFTALVRNEEDEEGEPFLTPDIQGKGYQISQYVCGMMSCYGYMKIVRAAQKVKNKDGEVVTKTIQKRRIIWQDNKTVRGKDRYNVLAPFTEDKTLQEITDLIKGAPAEVERPARTAPRKRAGTSN